MNEAVRYAWRTIPAQSLLELLLLMDHSANAGSSACHSSGGNGVQCGGLGWLCGGSIVVETRLLVQFFGLPISLKTGNIL